MSKQRVLDAVAVLDSSAHHPEGPFWVERAGVLGWVDIGAGALHLTEVDTHHDAVVDVGRPVGAAAEREGGGYVLAVEDGFALLDPGAREARHIVTVDTAGGRLRMNDGACDPAGRFWAGTMAYDLSPGAGSLYRLDPDFSVTTVLDGIGISNGIDWSDDGTRMYYVDSFAGLDVFSFDPASGTPSARRRLITIESDPTPQAGLTVPDGLTLDAEEHIWVAVYGAGEVRRYDPAGRLDTLIRVPAMCPTSCAFGGTDLATLFITAMPPERDGGPSLQPVIYSCRPGVRGRPARRFAG